jgi:hypothetical protein
VFLAAKQKSMTSNSRYALPVSKLVKYCSVECQKNHLPQHKKACKKRAAELRDELLLTQPDGIHLGECQICYLPLPIDQKVDDILMLLQTYPQMMQPKAHRSEHKQFARYEAAPTIGVRGGENNKRTCRNTTKEREMILTRVTSIS